MPEPFKEIINFEPITLTEMENVKLMDRVDSKYVFSASHFPAMAMGMLSDYKILEINSIRSHRYESLYFDTPDFQLYTKHHKGMLNRWKLRFRRYLDSDGLTFFEIKHKNNKARTIKNRVKMKAVGNILENKSAQFLREISPLTPEEFFPKIWVNYSRMTFVNKFSQERLTIDTGLHFIREDSGNKSVVKFPNLVIAEAKRDKASSVSPFIRLVRQTGVRESGISKYCFGIYHMVNEVKKNNFKEKIRFIHKMACTNNLGLST